MKRRTLTLTVVLAAAVVLTGCTAGEADSADAAASESAPTPESIQPTDIVTIDDGIEWARALTPDVDADELSEGITTIGELVPDLDIWFTRNNEIGMDLISLNAEVLEDPESAPARVDDLNLIVDDIEEAIEHGNQP